MDRTVELNKTFLSVQLLQFGAMVKKARFDFLDTPRFSVHAKDPGSQ